MTTEYVETRMVMLDELTPFPGNARRGDRALLLESLEANGQYRSLIVRELPDGDLVVLAGNNTLAALEDRGDPEARCEIVRCDDATALRVNLVDNRADDRATYDESARRALLDLLDGELTGSGYDEDDLTSLVTALDEPVWAQQQETEVREARELSVRETAEQGQPGADAGPPTALQRTVPLDAMFCCRYNSIALAAYEMGFLPGMISSKTDAWKKILNRQPGIRIGLMDNEWHDYDHAAHVAGVAEAKPKYATVRDVMTKAQCEAAGVDFLPLEEILEMAQDVAQHADHVIVIPKYDCLDKIPEEYVIGFSVPTSYGGTPMPASALRGRRVHLLGGSWKNQRAYLDILGEDVVSLDNNHLLRISEWGKFQVGNGRELVLRNLDPQMPRTWQAAAILSLASIRDELNTRYAAAIGSAEDSVPDASGYSHDDDTDQGEGS